MLLAVLTALSVLAISGQYLLQNELSAVGRIEPPGRWGEMAPLAAIGGAVLALNACLLARRFGEGPILVVVVGTLSLLLAVGAIPAGAPVRPAIYLLLIAFSYPLYGVAIVAFCRQTSAARSPLSLGSLIGLTYLLPPFIGNVLFIQHVWGGTISPVSVPMLLLATCLLLLLGAACYFLRRSTDSLESSRLAGEQMGSVTAITHDRFSGLIILASIALSFAAGGFAALSTPFLLELDRSAFVTVGFAGLGAWVLYALGAISFGLASWRVGIERLALAAAVGIAAAMLATALVPVFSFAIWTPLWVSFLVGGSVVGLYSLICARRSVVLHAGVGALVLALTTGRVAGAEVSTALHSLTASYSVPFVFGGIVSLGAAALIFVLSREM